MYSKYFCALTSSQRARKHRLPHFSLKNVANIRVWLALRAGKTWLRRHRRERSADAVVSSAFFLSLALLAAILAEVRTLPLRCAVDIVGSRRGVIPQEALLWQAVYQVHGSVCGLGGNSWIGIFPGDI